MDNGILVTIISVIFLALIVFFIYMSKKKLKNGKEEANKFLDGLKDALYNQLVDVIKNFDYSKISNLNEVEIIIIDKMIDTGNKYVQTEISKSTSILSTIALKVLNAQFIENFIDTVINNIDIFKSVEEQLGDRYQELYKTYVKEDSDLQKEYSNESIYYINDNNIKLDSTGGITLLESDEDGLEKRGFTLPSKAEEAKLNKPIEEEESFNENDESMEIVEEVVTSEVIENTTEEE